MNTRTRPMWRALPLLLVAFTLLATACGGGAETQATGAEKPAAAEKPAEPVPDPSLPLVEIATRGSIAFDTDRLEAPANEPFQILFRNASDQIHNVAVYELKGGVPLFRHPLFQGELFQGPATMLYEVPALEPGTYRFYCDAHSSEGMKGEFVVG